MTTSASMRLTPMLIDLGSDVSLRMDRRPTPRMVDIGSGRCGEVENEEDEGSVCESM